MKIIKTIRGMAEATNPENLDRFLEDLRSMLVLHHMAKSVADDEKVQYEMPESYTWVDDNNNKVIVSCANDDIVFDGGALLGESNVINSVLDNAITSKIKKYESSIKRYEDAKKRTDSRGVQILDGALNILIAIREDLKDIQSIL